MFHPVTCLKTVFFFARLCLRGQDNKTLKTLDIGGNEIGAEGVASLAKALTVLARNVTSLFFFGLRSRCFVLP